MTDSSANICSPVVALSGGVGGSKLVLGLSRCLGAGDLAVVVNTGDDFEHLGLLVCPDIDTLIYTLAGRSNIAQGWGINDETWGFMEELRMRGLPDWFQLGDRDLVTHVRRNALMQEGANLSEVTTVLATELGLSTPIVPMCDLPFRTVLQTSEGLLAFQDYFVRRRCAPVVQEIRFERNETTALSPAARALITGATQAIVICPSNPFLSIGPMLAVPDCVAVLKDTKVPVVAVSPIVSGYAIKGPCAKIMRELGLEVSCVGVFEFLQQKLDGRLDGFVIDHQDEAALSRLKPRVSVACMNTVMRDQIDKDSLARDVLAFAGSIR
jgi:LPPG:FO 2-phospho-L-lactate transferase